MRLLSRYKDGHTQGNKETGLKQEWSKPEGFMKALAKGLSLTTESLALPLNFSPHFTSYYSIYEEDQLFGANYNAYNTKWTGASQATPGTGSAATNKAVRWAIASAEQSQEPVLTALTLPWEGHAGRAYANWLTMVHEIKTIKKSHIVLNYPMQEAIAHPKQARTKWDVNFIATANGQGLTKILKQDLLASGFAKAAQNREDRVTRISNIHSQSNNTTVQL